MNIIFAGTPDFAVPAFEALLERHRVLAAYTQPDRPAGRGRSLQASPIKQLALARGVAVEQPASFRDADAVERLRFYTPDVMVVVAYGLILPETVLAVPRYGCINIHASLLPRWRGAAPIQRAILAGDPVTGVTIMNMDAGLDTGPMLARREVPIRATETAGSLHDVLAAVGAELIGTALAAVASGLAKPEPQSQEGATYARKIAKSEALIDWARSAVEIDRQVRAFNPVPGAETRWAGQQLKISEAWPESDAHDRTPGDILTANAQGIRVATGAGVLRLTCVQLAGRKPVSAAEFLNAHPVAGGRLGDGAGTGETQSGAVGTTAPATTGSR